MKDKIKYIVALLIAMTLSVVFVPLMNIGGFKLALFDIVKIGLAGYGYEDGSLEQILMSSISSELDVYVYIIIIFMIVLLFHAAMVAVLKAKISYVYAIASGIVMNVIVFIVYAGIKDAYEELQMAIPFMGIGGYISLGKAPVIIWLLCSVAAIGLSVLGMVLTLSNPVKNTGKKINPEDFYHQKNPWQNVEPLRVNKPVSIFYGGIKGVDGMYTNKIYPFDEMIPVYFVKKDQMYSLMKWDVAEKNLENGAIDEILGEVYYVPQYEEYVVKPAGKLKVFLASGQPLGKDRDYYLPRETEIYLEDIKQKFVLA